MKPVTSVTRSEYLESEAWGLSSCVDISECDPSLIRDREAIESFTRRLCELLGVRRFGEAVVVRFGDDPAVCGYSMVQLIETSLISAHFIESSDSVFLDLFSCRWYDVGVVIEFAKTFFKGRVVDTRQILRRLPTARVRRGGGMTDDGPFSNPVFTLVEARPSPVHGFGVFAREAIPCGTAWWRVRLADLIHFRKEPFETLLASAQSPGSREFVEAVQKFGIYSKRYDALFFIVDNGRFVNHSPQPNSASCLGSDGLFSSLTLRDIAAGEEMFEDYATYDKCPWANLYGELGRELGFWLRSPEG